MVKVNPEFLSVKDACTLLGVARVTLHRWRQEKKIVPHKVGGRVLYLRSEVIAAVAGLRPSTASGKGVSVKRSRKRKRSLAR